MGVESVERMERELRRFKGGSHSPEQIAIEKPEMREDQLMSRAEIRAWIDAEGAIESLPPPESRSSLRVVQVDRAPLEVFCRSVERFGIQCIVRPISEKRAFVAAIEGLEDVAKAIKEFGPFRTRRRQEQVERFIQNLLLPTRILRPERRRARAILGLPEVVPGEE
jgi:hypothetical protein